MQHLLECIDCDWQGHPDALEADPNYEPTCIDDYAFCPKCGGGEYTEVYIEADEGSNEIMAAVDSADKRKLSNAELEAAIQKAS